MSKLKALLLRVRIWIADKLIPIPRNTFAELMEIEHSFTSGNSTPVRTIRINHEQWLCIKRALHLPAVAYMMPRFFWIPAKVALPEPGARIIGRDKEWNTWEETFHPEASLEDLVAWRPA